MDRWQGKVALVTGASAGIGAAIVEKLVQNGMQVVGLARRMDRLEQLSGRLNDGTGLGRFHPFQADVTLEDDVVRAVEWARAALGTIHVLVNNAGIGRPTTLLDGPTSELRKVIDTNVMSVAVTTREVVKLMRTSGTEDGHVININSIAGHFVYDLPFSNVYPASKHALTAMTETLRFELVRQGSKIRITSVSPGFVETEIFSANGFLEDEAIAELVRAQPRLFPDDIANAVLYILGTPSHVQVSELIIRPTGSAF